MKKNNLLRWFLLLSGIFQIGYWSLSHLFFPKSYLAAVGMAELARNLGLALNFMHEIGILMLGIGFATILAAKDPIKNFSIILMLYVISIGSIGTSLYHIAINQSAPGEWSLIIIISVQLIILTILCPWGKIKGAQ